MVGDTLLEVVDVQSYGGYVLHVCLPSSGSSSGDGDAGAGAAGGAGSVAVGAAATAHVNYARRRKVAPNHTMTHVLNHALREVLGADVDQKGSLVDEEKFRFDFSSGRACTSSELERVEALVRDVIAARLPVSARLVPLQEAQDIFGLRAVFGEVYPDPVRVVSVGADVGALMRDPHNEAWSSLSVEFCGGIHLHNTCEAEGFLITDETAVAKGVRRVVGVTGSLAREAGSRAAGLQAETTAAVARVSACVGAASVPDAAEVVAVERLVHGLKASLDELVIAHSTKSTLRAVLDQVCVCVSGVAMAPPRTLTTYLVVRNNTNS